LQLSELNERAERLTGEFRGQVFLSKYTLAFVDKEVCRHAGGGVHEIFSPAIPCKLRRVDMTQVRCTVWKVHNVVARGGGLKANIFKLGDLKPKQNASGKIPAPSGSANATIALHAQWQ
jgi:hypothetical protein